MDGRRERQVLETPEIDILEYRLALKLLGNKNDRTGTGFRRNKKRGITRGLAVKIVVKLL
jgi:hypothetical protein